MKHANISLFVPHAGCPHQCSFCNQKTISGSVKQLTPEDVKETVKRAVEDKNNPETTEIAFFGGSFTAIEREYMISLLEEAVPYIKNGFFCGIRVSTRPDAIDEEVLSVLKKYGVTSIELGAQSTDDSVLLLNRRGHTRDDIIKASKLIKEKGFSLGLQMMTGLLGDTPEKSLRTADDIIALKPDTVRIYPTIVLEGTYLAESFKNGTYTPQTVAEAVSLCGDLLKRFYDNGIKVIRLGLHSGGNVEEGYIAGPYHPAFGELCESEIYLKEAIKLLQEKYPLKNENLCSLTKSKNIIIYVNDRELSKMIGQKGSNKIALKRLGWEVTVKGMKTLKQYEIEVE
jgi:histone acetyltransferase (RNA polymerase elongator complex component)